MFVVDQCDEANNGQGSGQHDHHLDASTDDDGAADDPAANHDPAAPNHDPSSGRCDNLLAHDRFR